MTNFKTLCENVIDELGVAGGSQSFPGVDSAVGEMKRIVRFVKQADINLCVRFIDWNFLWYDYSETLAAGAGVFPGASASGGKVATPNKWMTDSIWLNRGQSNAVKLSYVPWEDWRHRFRSQPIKTQQPSFFTIRPDKVLELDSYADKEYAASGEFYRNPEEMSGNTDTSLIPEQFHRLIEVRAKIMYAEREDAPEVLLGSSAEHDELMEAMEASQLTNFEPNAMGAADLSDIQMSIG